jgi:uncharacterized membrane protein YsdA (DUF1294 family)/cold shock CspA family protein
MHKGKLIEWQDDKGFGFIKPNDGGQQIFIHITALEKVNRRPKVGDVVHYQLTVDQRGRKRACSASIAGATSMNTAQPLPLALQVLLLAIFPVWGAIKLGLTISNPLPIILYVVMSLITFAIYAADKSRAINGRWRVPEKSLHLCELMGGWLGAFIAQQKLRHKSSKASYQIVFWLIVAAHIVFWVDWLFLGGTLMSLILRR